MITNEILYYGEAVESPDLFTEYEERVPLNSNFGLDDFIQNMIEQCGEYIECQCGDDEELDFISQVKENLKNGKYTVTKEPYDGFENAVVVKVICEESDYWAGK